MLRPASIFRDPARSARALACLSGLAVGALVSPMAVAQNVTAAAVDAGAISGRDFAGVRFPLAAASGELAFRADQASAWVEAGGLSSSGAVNRVVLSGDVLARIGTFEFRARRAAIWLERLDDAEAADGKAVYQVFAYFDRLSTPDADAAQAVSMQSANLPVRGIVEIDESPTSGGVQLRADLLRQGPVSDGFTAEAERALADTLRRQLTGVSGAAPSGEPSPDQAPLIFPTTGTISVSAGDIQMISGEQERSVIITAPSAPAVGPDGGTIQSLARGGIVVMYSDRASGRTLELTAQRGVIYLAKDTGPTPDLAGLPAGAVRGIYLEGGVVATDGRFTLRGPSIYYDLQANRAVVLDAVFWTYDAKRRLPLYVRASAIRQESADQFTAENVRLATTGFFEPDFTIGASKVTITRDTREVERTVARRGGGGRFGPGGIRLPETIGGGTGFADEVGPLTTTSTEQGVLIDAQDITLRAGDLPFFYWPRFRGDPSRVPLKDIRVENRTGSGTALRTRWNAYSLLDLEPDENIDVDLLIDGYFRRGLALGLEGRYADEDTVASLWGYSVFDDKGTDILPSGRRRSWEGTTRGAANLDLVSRLDANWVLAAQASHVGDEVFLESFKQQWPRENRELTNRAQLRYTDGNNALWIEGSGRFFDAVPNQYLLQSQGYSVSKAPEVGYTRLSDDLLRDWRPGLLTWNQEYRYTRARMQFDEPRARERGYDLASLSQRAFGIDPNQSIAERLRAEGYESDSIHRFDTRQELNSQLLVGPMSINPYGVGRVTAYDDRFSRFAALTTERERQEKQRYWGAVGTRFSTQIQRVDNSISSSLFDLNRIRHIVEPSLTLQQAGTNRDRITLPVYDDEVESLAEGGLMRAGVAQTWQTQRGGPGRWRSVDVLKWNSDVVFKSRDVDPKSTLTRFAEYRPELSIPGNAWLNEGQWQASNSLALTGSNIFDFDAQQSQRSTAGAILQHTPDFATIGEVRYLNAQESTVFDWSAQYRMTSKYFITGGVTYDLKGGGFQNTNVEVRRAFQAVLFGVNLSYNNITGETSFGFLLRPMGTRSSDARLGGVPESVERWQSELWTQEQGLNGLGRTAPGGLFE